jgi:uncharacterized protein YndB with AHSA1/START domain
MEKPKFIYVMHINTTPEKLWAALTKPEFTQQYWGGHRIQSDWTLGASVKFIKADGSIDLKGEVLRADPPKILSYTWSGRSCSGAIEESASRVTFEISTAFNVTKLTVTHEGFESGSKLLLEVTNGWQAVLSSLKTLLETGTALPFDWKK